MSNEKISTPRTDAFHGWALNSDDCEADLLLAYKAHSDTLERELVQAKSKNAALVEQLEANLRGVRRGFDAYEKDNAALRAALEWYRTKHEEGESIYEDYDESTAALARTRAALAKEASK